MPRVGVLLLLFLAAPLLRPAPSSAVTVSDAQALFDAGKYEDCVEMAAAEIDRGIRYEPWRHVKAQAEIVLGRYADALRTVEEGVSAYPSSIEMRLLAHEACLYNDRIEAAESQRQLITALLRARTGRPTTASDLVAIGEFLLMENADARQILELCYDPVTEQFPEYAKGHRAKARLALEKYDNRLAAQILLEAPEDVQENAEHQYLLGRAFASDDPQKSAEAIEKALELNPRHVDSLLYYAERLIDAEDYAEAHDTLEQVLEINARHPIALAYEATLANLSGDAAGEAGFREAALSSWSANPAIDHTIGAKLSDNYRFAEGAAYQRRSLAMDNSYLPARLQLAQDLLRLGQDEEGWALIQEVFATDGYNVVAHNLVTLHDSLQTYRTLADDTFRLRMLDREASIYGEQVLNLLKEAKDYLCEKYDVELEGPIIVEVFADKNDFAVRTFGMPGAEGFLGVCFGNLITANSPSALGTTEANWEAVLWHEFCHVVTLHKSLNKMPRWLSEGISVYEEVERNPAWGEKMTPAYRKMILQGEMAPVSSISSMFLAPKSAAHLQFAYFESSLAVRYIIDEYGIDALKSVLDDLADGVSINAALGRHVAPLGKLDSEFNEYIVDHANRFGEGMNWDDPDLPPAASAEVIAKWLEENPDSVTGQLRYAAALEGEENWPAVVEAGERLRNALPGLVGAGSPYDLLARAYKQLDQPEQERAVLEAWCERDGEAMDAYARLIEIGESAGDWEVVLTNAKRILAVDPLTPIPHRFLAEAAVQLGDTSDAIDAYRALLEFDTTDPVNAHFRLAKLMRSEQRTDEALRQVLLALEDAPRFLDAHRVLLELVEPADAQALPAEPLNAEPPNADPSNDSPSSESPSDDAPSNDEAPDATAKVAPEDKPADATADAPVSAPGRAPDAPPTSNENGGQE